MTEATTPAAPEKTTSYYVFTRADDTGVLTPIGDPGRPVTGANDLAAIRKAVTTETGTFVAIPARSLNPRSRTIETVQKDKWS